jgi:hypothetical protein
MDLITSLMDYRTHRGEKLPGIGVYYVFSGHYWSGVGLGLCRQFHLDLDNVRGRTREQTHAPSIPLNPSLVVPELLFEFKEEQWLLEYLGGNDMQAIRTNVADGVSFRDVSSVVAQMHFDQFLKSHPWAADVRPLS